jgi:hypothetical protein
MTEVKKSLRLTNKNIFCGKLASLCAQIISCIWIGIWSAMKFLSDLKGIDIFDVFLSGLAMTGCFSPVYLSIFFDKIKSLREKKE